MRVLVESGKAFFRVDTKVFFKSDVIKLLAKTSEFRCSYADAMIFKMVGVKHQDLSLLKKNLDNLGPSNKKTIFDLLFLSKLIKYSSGQKVLIKTETINLLKQAAIKNGCVKKIGRATVSSLKRFMHAEVLIRSRFVAEKDPKSLQEAMKAFRSSLNAQIPHQVYF